MSNTFVVVKSIEVPDEFEGPRGPTTTVNFRKVKAGDLLVMDGKGEYAAMQAFAAEITGLTPGMISKMSFENYALIMAEVRGFLEPLRAKLGA